MGARVYIPTLGRFLSVDPVEGGTPNNYVDALNPVNQFDLNGKWVQFAGLVVRVVAAVNTVKTLWKKSEPIRSRIGQALYNSEKFGRKSEYFGAKGLGADKSGKWNNNNFIRIGWGKAPGGKKAFRVVVGPESWKNRPHFDIFKGKYK